jgi:hypothetical protein
MENIRHTKEMLTKAIKLERDCKKIRKENFSSDFPAFSFHFYQVFGGEIAGSLLYKIQAKRKFDAIRFLWDLDEDNLNKFLLNY